MQMAYILALCKCILNQEYEIRDVHFFSAKVHGRRDHDQPNRQEIYFRALRKIPQIGFHMGYFLSFPQKMMAVESWPTGNKFHKVMRTEEKGSDLNLATQLLVDAFDVAVIISNDGDLKSPISAVRNRFEKTIGIIPHPRLNRRLKPLAHFTQTIPYKALEMAQFTDEMEDATGVFRKPKSWRAK